VRNESLRLSNTHDHPRREIELFEEQETPGQETPPAEGGEEGGGNGGEGGDGGAEGGDA